MSQPFNINSILNFEPMLCAQKGTLKDVPLPALISTKVDGIRAIPSAAGVVSRSLTPSPNQALQDWFRVRPELFGLDGEFVVGAANTNTTCARSGSAWSAHEGIIDDFRLYVFDDITNFEMGFQTRLEMMKERLEHHLQVSVPSNMPQAHYEGGMSRIILLPQTLVKTYEELEQAYINNLEAGWEGVVAAMPDGPYKLGRSTLKQGWRIKLKPRENAEARILSMFEAEKNTNEAKVSNVGRTKRSTAKDGKVGKDTCGGFVVEDIKTGVVFNLGGGKFFTDKNRKHAWETFDDNYKGKVMTYSFCPVGVKDKPRQPQAEQLRVEGT